MRRLGSAIAFLAVMWGGAGAPLASQTPDSVAINRAREMAQQRLGRPVSAAEITAALRQSGLSRDEVRARLRFAGLDTTLADPFFPTATGGTPLVGRPLPDVMPALQTIGLFLPEVDDSLAAPATDEDSLAVPEIPVSRVFGKAIFRPTNTVFDPMAGGPVDRGYRLGAGDLLQLVLTGQVEEAYTIEVRRDGTIFVPLLGQIPVAGLTLEGATGAIRQRAARPFSGVTSGAVQIDLTIARVRTIQVYVIGEVEMPGAYQINALATAFHALAAAGGPTEAGSFRRIEIRRAGVVFDTLDLYPYLISGDARADRRLEQGDVLFVPLADRRISTTGQLRRPMRFELVAGETLHDLLRYAGGLEPDAASDRVQVDRVLPPAERQPGMDRRLLDLALDSDSSQTALYDGDSLTVLSVGELRRQVVSISGEVARPGSYQFREGMTMESLVEAARGLHPWALADRLKVRRLVPAEGRKLAYDVDLTSPAGRAFVLAEFDSVTALDSRLAFPVTTVGIDGAVRIPFEMNWAEGLTLRDLVDGAGGFREEAVRVEVSRRHISVDYSDTNTVAFSFALDPGPRLSAAAAGFEILRDDQAYVTSVPGFRGQEFFRIVGMFRYPGTYAILEQGERLSSAIRRAGGLIPGAYSASFRVTRGGRHLSATLEAVTRGDAVADLQLEPGDVLSIGPDPGTVFVTGEVERSALVAFQRGRPLRYYLDRVGGVQPSGDRNRIVVEDPSGLARRTKKSFLFFRTDPEVRSGAIITVLAKPPREGGGFGQVLTMSLQTVTTLASLIIAYKALQ